MTGDEHTIALDRDTLAVGSFYSTKGTSCGTFAGTCPSYKAAGGCDGCFLDYRMAAQLVEWFGDFDWYLAYSGSSDTFSNSAWQAKMSTSSPSIVLAHSYHLADGTTVTGSNVFGGYTTKSWATASNTRCADSTVTGGSGSTTACSYWTTCSSTGSQCTGYTGPCAPCNSGNCQCCDANTCAAVCSHTSDANAYLFTLMANSVASPALFPSAGAGREVYICSSFGPAFGAQGSGTGNNYPPYTAWALSMDLDTRVASTDNYGFTGLSAAWAAGAQTAYLDHVEVYTLVAGATGPKRGLFAYAPRGAGSSGDQAVHLWSRNQGGVKDSWGYLKRVVLPAWADSWMYGFSVALDANTLVVGRRGNRDLYVHERHRSDCTPSGAYAAALCSDRGTYSADNWGLVQQLSFPGSSLVDAVSRKLYGAVWTPPACCNPPSATPAILVGEWGCAVDLSGDWLVVGAYKSSVSPGSNTGAAFTYQRDYAGNFIFAAQLTPSSTTSNQHCGKAP